MLHRQECCVRHYITVREFCHKRQLYLSRIKQQVLHVSNTLQNLVIKIAPHLKMSEKIGSNLVACQTFFLNVFLKSNLLCYNGIFKWQSECIYKDKHLPTDLLQPLISCVSTVHRKSWGWNVPRSAEVEHLSALKCNWSKSTAAGQRSTQWSAMLYFPFNEIQ